MKLVSILILILTLFIHNSYADNNSEFENWKKTFKAVALKNNISENIFKDFINEKNIENVNSKILVAKEKEINGVPFFEIGKDFISGAQSSIQLENVIKANLN